MLFVSVYWCLTQLYYMSNTTGILYETEIAFPSRPGYTPRLLGGVRVAHHLNSLCSVFLFVCLRHLNPMLPS